MILKALNILFILLVSISINSADAYEPDICMRLLDIEIEAEKLPDDELKGLAECIENELLKKGIKLCNTECLGKLAPEQRNKYSKNLKIELEKILNEERARRKYYAKNIKNDCLKTIQLLPGEGMTYEDNASFVSCIELEFKKRGIKDCDEQCLQKLSEKEKKEYYDKEYKAFEEIIEGEAKRRGLQSLRPSTPRGF